MTKEQKPADKKHWPLHIILIITLGVIFLFTLPTLLLTLKETIESKPKDSIVLKLQKIAQDTFSNKDAKVTTTPSKFLYEVQVGDTIAYFDASGEYLLVGDLYRVSDLENLTNSRKNEINPSRIITKKAYVPQQAPITSKNLSWGLFTRFLQSFP